MSDRGNVRLNVSCLLSCPTAPGARGHQRLAFWRVGTTTPLCGSSPAPIEQETEIKESASLDAQLCVCVKGANSSLFSFAFGVCVSLC
jgi:hypothetical protein